MIQIDMEIVEEEEGECLIFGTSDESSSSSSDDASDNEAVAPVQIPTESS